MAKRIASLLLSLVLVLNSLPGAAELNVRTTRPGRGTAAGQTGGAGRLNTLDLRLNSGLNSGGLNGAVLNPSQNPLELSESAVPAGVVAETAEEASLGTQEARQASPPEHPPSLTSPKDQDQAQELAQATGRFLSHGTQESLEGFRGDAQDLREAPADTPPGLSGRRFENSAFNSNADPPQPASSKTGGTEAPGHTTLGRADQDPRRANADSGAPPPPGARKTDEEPPSRHWEVVKKLHDEALRMSEERSEEAWEFLRHLQREGLPVHIAFLGNGPHIVAARGVAERRLRHYPYTMVTLASGFSPVFYEGLKRSLTADPATVGFKNPEEKFTRHDGLLEPHQVANVAPDTLAPSSFNGIVTVAETARANSPVALHAQIVQVSALDSADASAPKQRITVRNTQTGEEIQVEVLGANITGLGMGPELLSNDPTTKARAEASIAEFWDENVAYRVIPKKKRPDEPPQPEEQPVNFSEPITLTGNGFIHYKATANLWQSTWSGLNAMVKAMTSIFHRGVTNVTVILGGGDTARMVEQEAVKHPGKVYMAALGLKAQGKDLIRQEMQAAGGELLEGYVMSIYEKVELKWLDGSWHAANELGEEQVLSEEEAGSIKLAPGQSAWVWRVHLARYSEGRQEPYKTVLADAVIFAIGAKNPLPELLKSPTYKKDWGWSNRLHRYIARAARVIALGGKSLANFMHLIVGPTANGLRPDLYEDPGEAGPLAGPEDIAHPLNINKSPDSLQVLIHRTQEAMRSLTLWLLEAIAPVSPPLKWFYGRFHDLTLDPKGQFELILDPQTEKPKELAGQEGEAPNFGAVLAYARLMLVDSMSRLRAREASNVNFPTVDLVFTPAGEGRMKVQVLGVADSDKEIVAAALAKHPDLVHYMAEIAPHYGPQNKSSVRLRVRFLPNDRIDRRSFFILTNEEYATQLVEQDILENGQPTDKGYQELLHRLRTAKIDSPAESSSEAPISMDSTEARRRIQSRVAEIYRDDPEYQGGQIRVTGPFRKKGSGTTYYIIKVDGADRAVFSIYPRDRYREAALAIRGSYVLQRGNDNGPLAIELKDLWRVAQGEEADKVGILWRALGGETLSSILSRAQESRQLDPVVDALRKTMRTLARVSAMGAPVTTNSPAYLQHLAQHGITELVDTPEWAVALEHGDLTPDNVFVGDTAKLAGLYALRSYYLEQNQVVRFGDVRRDIARILLSSARILEIALDSPAFKRLEEAAARSYLAARGLPQETLDREIQRLIESLPAFYAAELPRHLGSAETGQAPPPPPPAPPLSQHDRRMAVAFAARGKNLAIPASIHEALRVFFSGSITWARRIAKLRESKPLLESILRIVRNETAVQDPLDPRHPLHPYLFIGITEQDGQDPQDPITLERFLSLIGLQSAQAAEAEALSLQIDREIDAYYGYTVHDAELKEAALRRLAWLRSHEIGWQHARLLQILYYRRAVAAVEDERLRRELDHVEVISDETIAKLDGAVESPQAKADAARMKLLWSLTRFLLLKADSRATNQALDQWEAGKFERILRGFKEQGLEIPPELEHHFAAVHWMGPRGNSGRVLAIRESLKAIRRFAAANGEKLKIAPQQNLYRLMTAGFTTQPWQPAPAEPVKTSEAAVILGWGVPDGGVYRVTAEDADARRKELEKLIRNYEQGNREPLLIEALTRTSMGVSWQNLRLWILAYIGAGGETIEDKNFRTIVMEWREVVSDQFVHFITQTVQQPEDKKSGGKNDKLIQNRTAVARMKYLRTLLDVLLRAREDPDFQRAVLRKVQETDLYRGP